MGGTHGGPEATRHASPSPTLPPGQQPGVLSSRGGCSLGGHALGSGAQARGLPSPAQALSPASTPRTRLAFPNSQETVGRVYFSKLVKTLGKYYPGSDPDMLWKPGSRFVQPSGQALWEGPAFRAY